MTIYSVTVSLPKNMKKLEDKYYNVLADIIIKRLSNSEIEYLLSEYKKQQSNKNNVRRKYIE